MLQMNPEIRAKWAFKLRSGEFEQGVEYLAYNDLDDGGKRKNCCMGVLCELALEEGVILSEYFHHFVAYGQERETRVLPQEVMDWAELSDNNPELRPYEVGDKYARFGSMMTCADANDGEHLSFDEIADLIDGGIDASS